MQTRSLNLVLVFIALSMLSVPKDVSAQIIYVPDLNNFVQDVTGSSPVNIGVGTSTPAYEFDVNGTVNAAAFRHNGQSVAFWKPYSNHAYYPNGNVGIGQAYLGQTFPEAKLHIQAGCTDVGFRLESLCDLTQNPIQIKKLLEIVSSDGQGNTVNSMVVDRSGRVGFGTTTPQGDLDVNGDIRFNGTAPQSGDILAVDASGNAVWHSPSNIPVLACLPAPVSNMPGQYSQICHSDAVEVGANNGSKIYMGGLSAESPIAWNAYPGASGATSLRYASSSEKAAKITYQSWAGKMKFVVSDPTQTVNYGSQVNWNDAMVIHNNGLVGIGTNTADPNYKLMVNGSVRAKEIVVETGWADFVFDDDYELRPLAEVEQFIQENKHLPDIPAGEVVESKGLNVGEMNARLMQKIEELTLYTIEQQKRIEALEQQR